MRYRPFKGCFKGAGKGTEGRVEIMDEAWMPSSSYSADECVCVGSDGHGHSVELRTRFTPQVTARIAELAVADDNSYRNSGDVIRDSVYHRLHYHAERRNDNGIRAVLLVEKAAGQLEDHRRATEAATALIEQAKDTLNMIRVAGDWRRLIAAIKQLREIVIELPDPYDGQLQEVLDTYEARIPYGYDAIATEELGEYAHKPWKA